MELQGPAGAGRTAAAGFVVAFLALGMGRLLMHGGWAWVLFVALLPVLLLVLALLLGLLRAVLFVAAFAGLVLAVGMLVRDNPLGWLVLLLFPVLALALFVCLKVLLRLRRAPA